MDEETVRERAAAEFEAAKRERETKDEERTRKNRERREKKRLKQKQMGNKQQQQQQGKRGEEKNNSGAATGATASRDKRNVHKVVVGKDGAVMDGAKNSGATMGDQTSAGRGNGPGLTTVLQPTTTGPGLVIHDDD